MPRFDLENENETIRNYRERVRQPWRRSGLEVTDLTGFGEDRPANGMFLDVPRGQLPYLIRVPHSESSGISAGSLTGCFFFEAFLPGLAWLNVPAL